MARRSDQSLIGVVVQTELRDLLQKGAALRDLSLSAYCAELLASTIDDDPAASMSLGTTKAQTHGAGRRVQLPVAIAERVCGRVGQIVAFYPIPGRPHSIELRPI